MSLRRPPLLALALSALIAAAGAHGQVRAGSEQAVLPVWNKGSGKVEALLLLEPARGNRPGSPGSTWRFGSESLDAAFGLGAGDSLGLLCSNTSGTSVNSLASSCLLASLGNDHEASGRRLSASASVGRQGNRLGVAAGTVRDASLPGWLSAEASGTPLAGAGKLEQNDLQVFGQKDIGSEAYVSIAGTYARARLVPVTEAPGLAHRWDSKSLSVGGGYGPFSANIIGRVVEVNGQPGNKWEGLGLGLTWRTPWSGQLTVGAENVVTRGKNPFAPSNLDAEEGTVPYVRYEQGL
ncbi:hypothetical protein EIM48_01430 [Pseudoxanthomonas sp. SGNA-20]|uniref:XOO1806 family protein n=1 Tax=unclassified Pseudoxanthomonas TaxID=2645906 RepID=UPI0002E9C2B5|nr:MULTISPECIES: hypothetical protein [unclassified Pseudoxanthomonas]RRN58727.1 hypothetical protein EIM48_01430 [Pseudoxanthomonas sp. SGNA-20]RRN80703.1 hypothetical protein EIM50_02470 [Pseudoxanthomonas sp. SGD-10]